MEQENKQGKVLERVKMFFLTHSMEKYLECQDVMIGSFLRDYMADINTYEMLTEFLKDLITMKDEILNCKA